MAIDATIIGIFKKMSSVFSLFFFIAFSFINHGHHKITVDSSFRSKIFIFHKFKPDNSGFQYVTS